MKTFCIIYSADFGGKAEYWLQASSRSAARTMFAEASRRGDLDYACVDLNSIEIIEREY